jgi:hypothetical protein
MELFCNNKLAISIAYSRVQHDRIKHIEVDRHFIKEKLDRGLITRTYIPSRYELTDALRTERVNQLTCKLGIIDIDSPA